MTQVVTLLNYLLFYFLYIFLIRKIFMRREKTNDELGQKALTDDQTKQQGGWIKTL